MSRSAKLSLYLGLLNIFKFWIVTTSVPDRIRIPIWIHRIHMFLGLPDSDPLVRRYGSGSGSLKNDVNVPAKRIKQKNFLFLNKFLLASWSSVTKIAGSGSIRQRHGSVDPDPLQNVMDPEHWWLPLVTSDTVPLDNCLLIGFIELTMSFSRLLVAPICCLILYGFYRLTPPPSRDIAEFSTVGCLGHLSCLSCCI